MAPVSSGLFKADRDSQCSPGRFQRFAPTSSAVHPGQHFAQGRQKPFAPAVASRAQCHRRRGSHEKSAVLPVAVRLVHNIPTSKAAIRKKQTPNRLPRPRAAPPTSRAQVLRHQSRYEPGGARSQSGQTRGPLPNEIANLLYPVPPARLTKLSRPGSDRKKRATVSALDKLAADLGPGPNQPPAQIDAAMAAAVSRSPRRFERSPQFRVRRNSRKGRPRQNAAARMVQTRHGQRLRH